MAEIQRDPSDKRPTPATGGQRFNDHFCMQIVTLIVAAGPMEGTPLIRHDHADRWELDADARPSNGEETANGQ